MKKPFVLIAAIVAVVGLGAAVAVAKETIKVGTSVSIRSVGPPYPGDDIIETGAFSGKVEAEQGCQKDRKIVLRHIDNGVRNSGSNRSDNRGRYIIRKDHFRRDRYFVKVKKKIIENDGDKVLCKSHRSKVIKVAQP